MDFDDDAPTTLDLRLVGNRHSIENVRLLLGFLEGCSRFGTTQRVELLVDGDGDFRFTLEQAGEPVRLSDAEETFLFAEPEAASAPPPALARLFISRTRTADGDAVLSMELV
ncbi:MAG: hypothetical protein SFW67_03105 [Myxococcaceae bacterium]|nr:hypothetical protein [Myxococcaceae bacterium]